MIQIKTYMCTISLTHHQLPMQCLIQFIQTYVLNIYREIVNPSTEFKTYNAYWSFSNWPAYGWFITTYTHSRIQNCRNFPTGNSGLVPSHGHISSVFTFTTSNYWTCICVQRIWESFASDPTRINILHCISNKFPNTFHFHLWYVRINFWNNTSDIVSYHVPTDNYWVSVQNDH